MSTVRESHFGAKFTSYGHKNLEDVNIVWFDRQVQRTDDCIHFQACLHYITDHFVVFDDPMDCQNYLLSKNHVLVFLIVSGTDGESFVPEVEKLSIINTIYIFCFETILHQKWTRNFKKIRGVYGNKDELLKILKYDASVCLLKMPSISVLNPKAMEKSTRELGEEGGSFIWSYLCLHILRNMQHNDDAKKDLLEVCRQYYFDDEVELQKIIDFEINYTPDRAIYWYTKDSFLYRLLNKALRTENFDIIYRFRWFIADLYQQLNSMHSKYVDKVFPVDNHYALWVYHGQLLPDTELQKLRKNVNGFIAINTFFSTTTCVDLAVVFSGVGEHPPLFESIVFSIKIEKLHSTEPFADITEVSSMNEEEVLFTLGSIFRIDSIIDPISDPKVTYINLSLVRHNNEDVGRLTEFLIERIGVEPTLVDLSDIFLEMGDYYRAIHYCKSLLEQKSISDTERAHIYLTWATAELEGYGDDAVARTLCSNAQKIASSMVPCHYPLQVHILSTMGGLEMEIYNYNDAIELFLRALQIALDNSFGRGIMIRLYNNLGMVYRKKRDYTKATDYYEKALATLKDMSGLPKLHRLFPVIYNNLAHTQQLQGNYDEALQYFEQAMEIEQQSLPSNHSIIATTLSNIGILYMIQDNDDKAIEVYEKALSIVSAVYGCKHPRLATIYHNIGDLFLKLEKNEQALEYLDKALEIRSNLDNIDVNDLVMTYTSLGIVHLRLKSSEIGLNCCQKALDLRLKLPNTEPTDISRTYLALALHYDAQFDYHAAQQYCQLAEEHCLPKSIIFMDICNLMADILSHMGKFDESISYYQKSIDIQSQLKFVTNNRLSKTYMDLGRVYVKKKEMGDALKHYMHSYNLASDDFIRCQAHIAIATVSLELKEFDKALEHLEKSEIIQNQLFPDDRGLAVSRLYIMGRFYYERRYVDIAFDHLNNALKIMKEYAEQDPAICDIYWYLALTLEIQNKMSEALEVFNELKRKCLTIHNYTLLIPCYFHVIIILRDKNLLEDALINKEEALALQWIDNEDRARIYDISTTIHIEESNYKEAHIEANKSLTLRQLHCPQNLPLSLVTLASILLNENREQEAIERLDQISVEQLRSFHEYQIRVRLGTDVATLYFHLKQPAKARVMIEFVFTDIQHTTNYLKAEINYLALKIYHMLDEKSQALNCIQQVLGTLDRENRYHHEIMIQTLDIAAKIHQLSNESQRALQCYEQMLTICKEENAAQVHFNIGRCHAKMHNVQSAITNYSLAISRFTPTNHALSIKLLEDFENFHTEEKDYAYDDPLRSLTEFAIAMFYGILNNYDRAAELLEHVLERQLKQGNLKETTKALLLLGYTQFFRKNIDAGTDCYNLALGLLLSISPTDYAQVANVYYELSEAYNSINDCLNAAEALKKAAQSASQADSSDPRLMIRYRNDA